MSKQKNYGNRTDYPIEDLGNGVYRIDDFGAANCYLVVGDRKAMLIDCGVGFGDLKAALKKITPLPIVLAVTHVHPDHIGGQAQFDDAYVPRADFKKFLRFINAKWARGIFVMKPQKERGIGRKDIRKTGDCKWIAFDDGQKFDLGGRTVTAISTPGHSLGSVVFIDSKSKIVFTGDDVCLSLFLFLPCCTSVEQWLIGAKTVLKLCDEYTPYCGHMDGIQTKEQISKIIQYAEQILIEQPKNAKLSFFKIYPKFSMTEPNIIYRKGNVHQRLKR